MDNISFEAVRNLMCRYAIGGYSLRQGLNSIDEICMPVLPEQEYEGLKGRRRNLLEVVGQKGKQRHLPTISLSDSLKMISPTYLGRYLTTC
jgi:hypothetical protein